MGVIVSLYHKIISRIESKRKLKSIVNRIKAANLNLKSKVYNIINILIFFYNFYMLLVDSDRRMGMGTFQSLVPVLAGPDVVALLPVKFRKRSKLESGARAL